MVGSDTAKLVIRVDNGPAEVVRLKSGVNRLGRSSENDFQIHHPTLSRFHCEIHVSEDAMFVRDLDSSNGTFLDNEPVLTETKVEEGQILRLGDVEIEIKESPKPARDLATAPCSNHPEHPASMQCTKCGMVFCGACVHILKRINGQLLKLCPECSAPCEPIKRSETGAKAVLGGLMKKIFKRGK